MTYFFLNPFCYGLNLKNGFLSEVIKFFEIPQAHAAIWPLDLPGYFGKEVPANRCLSNILRAPAVPGNVIQWHFFCASFQRGGVCGLCKGLVKFLGMESFFDFFKQAFF